MDLWIDIALCAGIGFVLVCAAWAGVYAATIFVPWSVE